MKTPDIKIKLYNAIIFDGAARVVVKKDNIGMVDYDALAQSLAAYKVSAVRPLTAKKTRALTPREQAYADGFCRAKFRNNLCFSRGF